MPWKVVKHEGEPPRDGGPWCVHKENEDGSVGEAVACHESEEKAKAHSAALYANVPEGERALDSRLHGNDGARLGNDGRALDSRLHGNDGARLGNDGRALDSRLHGNDGRGAISVQANGGRWGRGGQGDGIERRDLLTVDVELRVDGESGAPTVEGYAAVFDSLSEVIFEWDNGRFREKVAPGAFAKTLREQNVPLLVEHANLPLATTGSGTLLLAEDGKGLRFSSILDPTDPDVQRLVPKMRRGDMNKTSFGFIPIRDSWDAKAKPRLRTLHEVRLVDVSIVARPAYSATTAKVRAELMEAGLDPELLTELLVRLRRGLPLDEEDTALMLTLTNTFRAYLPQPPVIAAPPPVGHPAEQERSSAPDPGAKSPPGPPITGGEGMVHPLEEQWRRLERLERLLESKGGS